MIIMKITESIILIIGELTEGGREGLEGLLMLLLSLLSEIGLRRTVVRSETKWAALLRKDCFLPIIL